MHRIVDIEPQTGGWLPAKAGDYIRITDVEGSQVSDMFAVSTADMTEWLGAGHTRCFLRRLFPRVGDVFVTNRFRPMMTFLADASPGVHDMLWRACDPHLYALAGFEGYHPSCNENFRIAAARMGWNIQEVPDPVDWFQNTPVEGDDLQLGSGRGPTKAGHHVILRAEMDLNVIATACAFDVRGSKINGDRCTGIRLEVSDTPFTPGGN